MKYIINKQDLGEDKFICTVNFEPQELKDIIYDKYHNGYKHEYILRMFFTQDEINDACLHEGFDITLEKQYLTHRNWNNKWLRNNSKSTFSLTDEPLIGESKV